MNDKAEQGELIVEEEEQASEIILPPEKKQEPMSVVDPNATQGQSLIQAIERVALNPNADIAKMEKLMEMEKKFLKKLEMFSNQDLNSNFLLVIDNGQK